MRRTTLRLQQSALRRALICCLLFIGLFSCEKDDICVDGDTPLLIIRFLDNTEPDTSKDVNRLRVIGLGQEFPVNTFADRSTLDSIAIPLRPEEPETTFILINDSEDEDGVEIGNADTLRFSYGTTGAFISRACGFVANYENLESELEPDTENWIQTIEVLNASVQTQDTTHVAIFH